MAKSRLWHRGLCTASYTTYFSSLNLIGMTLARPLPQIHISSQHWGKGQWSPRGKWARRHLRGTTQWKWDDKLSKLPLWWKQCSPMPHLLWSSLPCRWIKATWPVLANGMCVLHVLHVFLFCFVLLLFLWLRVKNSKMVKLYYGSSLGHGWRKPRKVACEWGIKLCLCQPWKFPGWPVTAAHLTLSWLFCHCRNLK